MNSPETAGATRRSLTQDWLYALQYWLRGRNGAIALVVLALVIGAALNWSWLVAVGIAPLLLTVLPCAVMCGLGLCMNKMTRGSCSTSSSAADHPGTPMLKVGRQITAAPEPDREVSAADSAGPGALPDLSRGGSVEPAPEQPPQVHKDGAGGSMMDRGMMGQRHDGADELHDGELQPDDAGDDGDGHEPARPNEQWRDRPPRQPEQPDQPR